MSFRIAVASLLLLASCTAANLDLMKSSPTEKKEKLLTRIFSASNIMLGIDSEGGKANLEKEGFTEEEIETLEYLNTMDTHVVTQWLGVKPERMTELFMNPGTRNSLVEIHTLLHRGSGHAAYESIKEFVLEEKVKGKWGAK